MLQRALMRRTSSVLPDPGAPSSSTSSERPCVPRAAIETEVESLCCQLQLRQRNLALLHGIVSGS